MRWRHNTASRCKQRTYVRGLGTGGQNASTSLVSPASILHRCDGLRSDTAGSAVAITGSSAVAISGASATAGRAERLTECGANSGPRAQESRASRLYRHQDDAEFVPRSSQGQGGQSGHDGHQSRLDRVRYPAEREQHNWPGWEQHNWPGWLQSANTPSTGWRQQPVAWPEPVKSVAGLHAPLLDPVGLVRQTDVPAVK